MPSIPDSRPHRRRVEEAREVDPNPRLEVTMQQLSQLHFDDTRAGARSSLGTVLRAFVALGLLGASASVGVTACGGESTTSTAGATTGGTTGGMTTGSTGAG